MEEEHELEESFIPYNSTKPRETSLKMIVPDYKKLEFKNGQWSQTEHMRYVVFIDFYKSQLRSKQIRKSNQFYLEMSQFISTRNSLQCRSHHQKMTEKYTFVNKIIIIHKPTFHPDLYQQAFEQLTDLVKQKDQRTTGSLKQLREPIERKQMEVQTEIGGADLIWYYLNANTIIFQRRDERGSIGPNPLVMRWGNLEPQN